MKSPIAVPSTSVRKWSHYLPLSIFAITALLYLIDYMLMNYKKSVAIGIANHFNELLYGHIFDFYGVVITLSGVIITVMITIMTIIANMTINIERNLIMKKKDLYEGYPFEKRLREFMNAKKDAYAVNIWVVISMLAVLIMALLGYIFTIKSVILLLLLLCFLFIGVVNFVLASLFVMGLIRIVLLSED